MDSKRKVPNNPRKRKCIDRLRALRLGPYRIRISEPELARILQPITITLQPPHTFLQWDSRV